MSAPTFLCHAAIDRQCSRSPHTTALIGDELLTGLQQHRDRWGMREILRWVCHAYSYLVSDLAYHDNDCDSRRLHVYPICHHVRFLGHYCGLPVTREFAQAVVLIIPGHEKGPRRLIEALLQANNSAPA